MRFSLIVTSIAMLLATFGSVEGAKLGPLIERKHSMDQREESMKGCSLSSLNKCYGTLPPDGSTPNHLIEEIGQIPDAQTCQSFCKDLYNGTCEWFMFDRTTNDCKLFYGSLDNLRSDCKEVGYAKEPDHSSCDVVFESDSENGCYNFREDYCRFEFSLLENLEAIESLSECQLACGYIHNCSYFVYDNPTKICKLNTFASSRPVCDIIHGTPEPDFDSCVTDGYLDWASNENNTQSGKSSSNVISPVDCEWGPYGDWSSCSKPCGVGEKTRSRSKATLSSNGGQECEGEASEATTCNTDACPVDCEWGPYGDWSSCSKPCGGGEKSRSRSEARPASNGGQSCVGESSETASCNEDSCLETTTATATANSHCEYDAGNLALGKPTGYNTIAGLHGVSGGSADGIVDGVKQGSWSNCVHTSDWKTDPYVFVDLETTATIQSVTFDMGPRYTVGWSNGGEIRISSEPFTNVAELLEKSTICKTVSDEMSNAGNYGEVNVECDEPMVGRYVAFIVQGDREIVAFCEMEVHGCADQ